METAAAHDGADVASDCLGVVVEPLALHQAVSWRVVAIGEVEQLFCCHAQAIALCEGLGCGHRIILMSGRLTTSAASYRGGVMAGAQGLMPQIVCPDGRLSGDASKGCVV
jgi:hypothetical protein